MDKIIQVIKDHPLPILGGVVVLLFLMRSGGGASSSSAGVSAGNSDAYILQSQKINSDANIAVSNINANASVQRAKIASENFIAQTNAQASIAIKNSGDMVSAMLGAMSASNTRNTADNNLTLGLNSQYVTAGTAAKSIAADVQKYEMGSHVQIAGINADLQKAMMTKDIAVLNNNLATTLAGNNFTLEGRKIDVASKALDVGLKTSQGDQSNTLYSLETQRKSVDYAAQNLPTILSSQQAIAAANNASLLALAQINSQTQIQNTKLNTEAARKKADTNIFNSLVGGITSIFGF